jgi:hypothetical protein
MDWWTITGGYERHTDHTKKQEKVHGFWAWCAHVTSDCVLTWCEETLGQPEHLAGCTAVCCNWWSWNKRYVLSVEFESTPDIVMTYDTCSIRDVLKVIRKKRDIIATLNKIFIHRHIHRHDTGSSFWQPKFTACCQHMYHINVDHTPNSSTAQWSSRKK